MKDSDSLLALSKFKKYKYQNSILGHIGPPPLCYHFSHFKINQKTLLCQTDLHKLKTRHKLFFFSPKS